jgi:hypothetical protein
MALTTDSVDPKRPAPAKPADKSEEKADGKMPEPVAAPGATDPVVQKLLADQQTAVSNGDADAIRDINAKLNELGYK